MPAESLAALRQALTSRPSVRRAHLDGLHVVLELDEVAADIDEYRAEIHGSMEAFARRPPAGVVVYERADA